MEYRDTAIVRVMLLTGLDRPSAERRIEAYTSGRIGRRELYARPDEVSAPPESAPPARSKRLPKSRPRARPRRDLPAPRPHRSWGGPPRVNTDALDHAAILRPPAWPDDYMYVPDVLQTTIRRFESWVLSQVSPPDDEDD